MHPTLDPLHIVRSTLKNRAVSQINQFMAGHSIWKNLIGHLNACNGMCLLPKQEPLLDASS